MSAFNPLDSARALNNLQQITNESGFTRRPIWTPTDTTYVIFSEVISFLSVAGSLTIIALYWAIKDIRTTSRLLVVYLSIADLFVALATQIQNKSYAVSYMLPDPESIFCQLSAWLYVQSQMMAALWTSAVIGYLFICVVFGWVSIANRIIYLFHIFCWGMPVLVGTIAYSEGVFGYNTADIITQKHPTSCWISDNVGDVLPWYLITVEGWVIAAYCLIFFLYLPISFSVVSKITKEKDCTDEDVIEELAKQTANEQLRFIPAIYVCTRLWGTLHFQFTRYHESHLRASDWLLLFRAVGDNCQGLINAIFFCLATKQVRKLLGTRLRCCCICFRCFCQRTRTLGQKTWMRVPIVKVQRMQTSRQRALDGSDLDISGISLDLPSPDDTRIDEDEVIFER